MDDPGPLESGAGPDSDHGWKKLRLSDIVKFAVALLASLGLGRVANFLRKRSRMTDRNRRQRRVVGPRKRDNEEQARRTEGAPESDAEEGSPRDASSDDESEVEEAHREHADGDAQIEEQRAIGHETEDVRPRALLAVAIISAVFLGVVLLGLYGLFNYFVSRPVNELAPVSGLPASTALPPGPRLQVDPPADWQALRATEEAGLNSYGWADQAAGRVKIPIDRAMDLVAERGLPVRSGSTRRFGDGQQNVAPLGGQPTGTSTPPTTAPAPTGAAPQAPAPAPQPTGTPTGGGGGAP